MGIISSVTENSRIIKQNNAMKKHLLLTIIALFSFSMGAWAETYSGNCGLTSANVKYSFDTETGIMTISGFGDGIMKSWLDRPGDRPWASFRKDIVKLVIDEGVTLIGAKAFYECSNLTEISLPKSLNFISSCAFSYCI